MLNRSQAERIGRYQLRHPVGSGSLGTVYLAELNGAGRFSKPVALKVIRADADERDALHSMFCEEARIASRIEHPNVCTVYDFGEEGDALFLAMEYLKGRSLEAIMRRVAQRAEIRKAKRFVPVALKIISDVAEGIAAAHQVTDTLGKPLAVVHRDISPRNIFLTSQGGVRITDFGVSGAVSQRLQTTSIRFRGRIPYRSPESFRGEEMDAASDLWALGVVLFELLAGEHPFLRPTDAATMHAILEGTIPSLTAAGSDLPEGLDAIIGRLLERDRSKRSDSAAELAQGLNRLSWSLGDPVSAAELRGWYRELFGAEADRDREDSPEKREGRDRPGDDTLDNAPTTKRADRDVAKKSRRRVASPKVAHRPGGKGRDTSEPASRAKTEGERASSRRREAPKSMSDSTMQVSRVSAPGLTTAAILVASLAAVGIVAFAVYVPRLTNARERRSVEAPPANTEPASSEVREPAPGRGAVRIRTLSGGADVYELEANGRLRRIGRTPLSVDLNAGERSLQIWHDTGERERRNVQVVEGAEHLIAIP